MKRNKCGRFVSSAVAQKMERLSEAQRQRWLRARRPRPTGEAEAEPPATGRAPTAASLIMTTSYCRLCHGKFSSRSLRNVFAKVPLIETSPERQRRAQQTFCGDFQKLVGVVVRQDSTLPQYICRNCHAQFYKCWTILKNFIQKVNTSPVAAVQHGQKASRCVAATETSSVQSLSQSPLSNSVSGDFKQMLNDSVLVASPQGLQILVTWAHHHGSSCGSQPHVQSVLTAEYRGVVGAVWGCPEGHSYILDMHSSRSVVLNEGQCPSSRNKDSMEEVLDGSITLSPRNGTVTENGEGDNVVKHQPVPVLADFQPCIYSGATSRSVDVDNPESLLKKDMFLRSDPEYTECSWEKVQVQDATQPLNVKKPVNCNEASCSVRNDVVDGLESSDLSERYLSSEDDREIKVKNGSSDESFQPYWKKKSKLPVKKCNIKDVKKQSGQKRGRKPKSNLEREDFPTMYRCQYKGCCAVYRGVDGLKKHIKEQHEEVRERPCPHPGCNKVFLIDRYLQRHVKLIHTEERNYICDECGQTFKQRKHLSVHQMRHTGAKPLQCEVCGFQCRQRASLKYHMTKHKAEAELEFACDQCEKRFEKAHNLNVHMSMVHPLTQNTDKNKPIEIESSQLSIETLIKQEPS
ncbi:LOW QUALITY PROTEIN: zinc finger protein 276-like [Leucoraja erinacea]|uniref:LOW QUALITY PROTEIN: zinc finger protein 276-like n=1 Tax=Leucoraja erinaceus TaxID=7782 RepID=UPI0024587CF1|nr:LOW QUALITY PROTEIN: zinc finger protein 276-like [Leucoraja erinacea]